MSMLLATISMFNTSVNEAAPGVAVTVVCRKMLRSMGSSVDAMRDQIRLCTASKNGVHCMWFT